MQKSLVLLFLFISSFGFGQSKEILMPYVEGNLYGYANADAKIIVEPKYTYTSPFENGFGRITKATEFGHYNKYGLINEAGQVILKPVAKNYVQFDSNGLAIVETDNATFGMINKKGDWVLSDDYEQLEIISNYIKAHKRNGKVSLFNLAGQKLVNFEFDDCYFQNKPSGDFNFAVIRKGEEYGLVRLNKKDFQILITPQYSVLQLLDNGFCSAVKGGKTGLISTDNEVIIPFEYDGIRMKDGFLIAKELIYYDSKIKISEMRAEDQPHGMRATKQQEFDDENRIVYYLMSEAHQKAMELRGYKQKLRPLKRTKVTVFNSAGEILMPSQFSKVEVRGPDLITVRYLDSMQLYDGRGKLLPTSYLIYLERISEGLMLAKSAMKPDPDQTPAADKEIFNPKEYRFYFGYVNGQGKTIIPFKYEAAYAFRKGIAPVKLNGKWGLIDQNGQSITDLKYTHLYYAGENRYAFMQDSLLGLLDLKGNEVIPAKYVMPEMKNNSDPFGKYGAFKFAAGLANLYRKKPNNWQTFWTMIDSNGRQLFPHDYINIERLPNGLFIVKVYNAAFDSERYGVVNSKNDTIVPILQKEINWLINEKLFKVTTSKNEVFYYDQEGAVALSPYQHIESKGLYNYRLLANGFYVATERDKAIYFTPSGVRLQEKE